MITKTIKKDNTTYIISDEKPKTGDKVLTDDYGVWEFHEGTAPLPYWCNTNTCKKIIDIKRQN